MSRTSDNIDDDYQEEWLSAYLDDELTPSQRAIVEQRLQTDQAAQLLFNDLSRIRGLVANLPEWTGGDITAAVLASIHPLPPVAEEPGPHDELIPDAESDSLASSSISATLERDQGQHDDDFTSRQQQRSTTGWLRPLTLAATLLAALGIGYYLWQGASPWSLASLSQTAHVASEPTSNSASADKLSADASSDSIAIGNVGRLPLPPESAPPEDLAVPLAAPSPAETQARNQRARPELAGVPAPNNETAFDAAQRGAPLATPDIASVTRSSEQELAASAQPRLAAPRAPATSEMNLQQTQGSQAEPSQAKANLRDPNPTIAGTMQLADEGQPNNPPPPSSTAGPVARAGALQIYHSPAWQAAEVKAALAQVAPLLGLRVSLNATDAERQAAPFPIAIISHNLAELGRAGQTASMRQGTYKELSAQDLGVVQLVPGPSVLLFVKRSEAEQMIESAVKHSQQKSTPVWITSATATRPTTPDDKVVVVINPL